MDTPSPTVVDGFLIEAIGVTRTCPDERACDFCEFMAENFVLGGQQPVPWAVVRHLHRHYCTANNIVPCADDELGNHIREHRMHERRLMPLQHVNDPREHVKQQRRRARVVCVLPPPPKRARTTVVM